MVNTVERIGPIELLALVIVAGLFALAESSFHQEELLPLKKNAFCLEEMTGTPPVTWEEATAKSNCP